MMIEGDKFISLAAGIRIFFSKLPETDSELKGFY